MTATVSTGIRFCPGTEVVAADAVHTTPLGYDRDALAAGTPLPVPASVELTERLSECDAILVSFHGKLGDSLLALSAVRALCNWFALRPDRGPMPIRAEGPYAQLLARSGLITHPPGAASYARFVVLGDREFVARHRENAHVSVVCDPAAPPCWSSGGRAYADMPARYYLSLERRLGVRLHTSAPFSPTLTSGENRLSQQLQASGWFDGLTIAAITATSWPERKDYTAERFAEVAARIADARRTHVRLLLVGGAHDGCVRIAAAEPGHAVRALHLDGLPADDLADVFPRCDLVLGNDTGLTHLAAMARRADGGGPPVIGLYARHSHSKWRTGQPHHHAVATPFSERMHQGDLCPVRDVIAPDSDVHLDAITPGSLARVCADLLGGAER
ncbi:Glycosyltransferase family 9 (heptosyltransferase) [Actinacidiphila guanduensis]|uniref:Glycosyltransferase family 9 (Heptosyltransferase) n=1 Tax=Actinacidiphila guanduensis TaxID=310781 RepID=A0A1G9YK34_9ACTN|nr:Glycosyltransferase family 9 (heptosyltransferase) [Actinacidiphila guanduensis]